ncbi:MAG: hypothetical protein HY288_12180 [Planctomycetia bacterium]|nr:hypothetical protein [Planctomycetia bacterium]
MSIRGVIFDLDGTRVDSVLFSGNGQPRELADNGGADFVLQSFVKPSELWAWWVQIDLGGSGGSC